ncbi:MAG TPA: hypothetical protein PK741_07405 [Petrotogaceae bacterium]|nr:hypothetical protein [Petrotogaceae bacterium]
MIGFAIFIIILGVLFIVNGFSLGVLTTVMFNFLSLWPVILIFIGLGILSSIKGLRWIKWISMGLSVIFVLMLFFNPFSPTPNAFINRDSYDYGYYKDSIKETVDGSAGEISIIFETGSIAIDILTDDTLSEPEIVGSHNIDSGKLAVVNEGSIITFATDDFHSMLQLNKRISLKLPAKYSYYIQIKSGVVDLRTDDMHNSIKRIKADCGVINCVSSFGRIEEPIILNMKAGISNIKFNVEKESTYRMDRSGGINSTHIYNLKEDRLNPDMDIRLNAGILVFEMQPSM